MSKFKYPYQCMECGRLFDMFPRRAAKNITCHSCRTHGQVIYLPDWEKEHLIAAHDFIKAAKKAQRMVVFI